MSPENTATSTEFALIPPQTIDEPTGRIVDDVRAVDPGYGGLLAEKEAKVKSARENEVTMSTEGLNWQKMENRRLALSTAVQIRSTGESSGQLIADAKVIEAYLLGE